MKDPTKLENLFISSIIYEPDKRNGLRALLRKEYFSPDAKPLIDILIDLLIERKDITEGDIEARAELLGYDDGYVASLYGIGLGDNWESTSLKTLIDIHNKAKIEKEIRDFSEKSRDEEDAGPLARKLSENLSGIISPVGESKTIYSVLADQAPIWRSRSGKNIDILGHKTSLPSLDRMIDGIQPNLYIVTARPSMGKTVLGRQIANSLDDQGVYGRFFSIETSIEQLALRDMSRDLRIPARDIRLGRLTEDQWARISSYINRKKSNRTLMNDDSNLTVEDLEAYIRKGVYDGDLGYVMIDYLQLMSSKERFNSTPEKISHITRKLRAITKEYNIPVIVLAQQNRSIESTTMKKPHMGAIEWGGSTEQDAYCIISIWRPSRYDIIKDEDGIIYPRGYSEITVHKNKDGPIGTIRAKFIGGQSRFDESFDLRNLRPLSEEEKGEEEEIALSVDGEELPF